MENPNYDLMRFPFEFNSFRDLTKTQTSQFFEWYVGQSASRITQLYQYAQSTNGTALSQDYTPQSLTDLWEWFEPQIAMVEKTAEEYQGELEKFPSWLHNSIPKETMSAKTLALVTDISFYFAETFIRNNPTTHWGYFTKPKNEVSVNIPVLMGFRAKMKLDPRRIVHTCASKSAETRDKNRLFDLYHAWLDYIEK